MQVVELYALSVWVQVQVISPQVVQRYQALQKALNQAAQQGQQQQSFESQTRTLIDVLTAVPLSQLSAIQLNMLAQLQIADHLGLEGVEKIKDILYRNRLDAATAANQVSEIIAQLNGGIEKTERIRTALEGQIDEPDRLPGEASLRIIFTRDASINYLGDLKDWSNIWFQIVEGITRAHGATQKEFRVIGASTGSMIVELASQPGVVIASIGFAIKWGLEAIDKIMEIRKKAAEIRVLDTENSKKIAKSLDDEADKIKSDNASKIADQICIKFEINQAGRKNNIEHLEPAITKLLNFLDKGGEVDAWFPPEEEDDEEDSNAGLQQLRFELKEAFEDIRRIEDKRKLLEYTEAQSENDDETEDQG